MQFTRTIRVRLLAFAVVSVLAASLAACGKQQAPPGVNETPEMQRQRKEKSGE